MKNALFLVGIWVGIILFAYAVVYLPGEPPSVVKWPGDVETVDATHGLALPLPIGWSFRQTDGYGILTAPIGGIEGWTVEAAGATVDEAASAAWEIVDPCSSCARPAVISSDPIGEGGTRLTLGPDDEGRSGVAVVLLSGETSRVLLLRFAPNLDLPARVQAEIERIVAGFRALPQSVVPAEPVSATMSEPAA